MWEFPPPQHEAMLSYAPRGRVSNDVDLRFRVSRTQPRPQCIAASAALAQYMASQLMYSSERSTCTFL